MAPSARIEPIHDFSPASGIFDNGDNPASIFGTIGEVQPKAVPTTKLAKFPK